MKKQIFTLLAVLTLGFASFAQTATATAVNNVVVTNLSTERFKAIIANAKPGELIDLRTTDEMNKGFIKGAVQLDFLAKDAEKQIDKLDKNKPYYVYCAAGGRSSEASEYMSKHGFKQVYNLEKGFSDWAKKGLPVEKK